MSEWLETNIAGIVMMNTGKFVNYMKENNISRVRLVPEEHNTHDSNAIAVFADLPIGAYKIGYIPNKGFKCKECGTQYDKKPPYCSNTIKDRICASMEFDSQGMATKISNRIREGAKVYAGVRKNPGTQQITGFVGEGKPNPGVYLTITIADQQELDIE
jgi:hypothetical protein